VGKHVIYIDQGGRTFVCLKELDINLNEYRIIKFLYKIRSKCIWGKNDSSDLCTRDLLNGWHATSACHADDLSSRLGGSVVGKFVDCNLLFSV